MFSHKLFISCSILCILYPVVITAGEQNAAPHPFNFVKFGSILSQLNCNPSRSTICNSSWPKPFIGKHVRDVTTIVQGLAILVGYAFSLVMSLIFLSVVLLRCRVSTNFGLQNSSFDQEIMPIIIVVLIMFQLSTFPCIWQRPRAMRSKPVIVLPYFEKGFIQSVYTETTSIIRLLLLLSGDVELNPGPPPSGKRSHTEEASSSGYETEHLPISNGAMIPDSTEKDSSLNSEGSMCSQSAQVDTQSFAGPRSAYFSSNFSRPVTSQNGHRFDSPNITHPDNLDSEPVRPIRMRKTQTCPDFMPRGLTNKVEFEQMIKTLKKQAPLRSYSYPMSYSVIQNAATKQSSDLILPSQSATLLDPEDPYLIKLKSRVKGLLENVKGWNKENGFQTSIESETLIQFYLLINQLYRAGGECDLCLLCGKLKTGKIDSHVFPRCLLEAFSKIHCDGESNCVFDPSTGKCMGANSLTLPLFCSSCEMDACDNECRLKNLYITIMAKGDKQIKITDDQVQWLKKILAILMFRGCLTGINFLVEQNFFKLIKWLIALRKFIRSGEDDISKRLALYLIPNNPFNPNNADPSYILDFVLRCPSFTSLVRSKGRTFFYTQFDCFHCVLPFDDVEQKFACDASMTHVTNCFFTHSPSNVFYLPSSEAMKRNFPSLLLQVNCWRTLEMEIILLRNQHIGKCCRIVTPRFPNRSSYNPVLPNITWPSELSNDEVHNFDDQLDKATQKEYIRIAHDSSPFVSNQIKEIRDLINGKAAVIEQKRNLQSQYDKLKNKYKKKNQETQQLEKHISELTKENEWLKQRVSGLEKNSETTSNDYTNQPTLAVVPQQSSDSMASANNGT